MASNASALQQMIEEMGLSNVSPFTGTDHFDHELEIISEEVAWEFVVRGKALFQIIKYTLRHETFEGDYPEIVRFAFVRPDAVAILPINLRTGEVRLTYQFRAPVKKWLAEIPAGTLEDDELGIDGTVADEMAVEMGILAAAEKLVSIGKGYVSGGGTPEAIHMFILPHTPADIVGEGGGDETEGEYITTLKYTIQEAIQRIESEEIEDLKTMYALKEAYSMYYIGLSGRVRTQWNRFNRWTRDNEGFWPNILGQIAAYI